MEHLNHKFSSTESKLKRACSNVDYRYGKIKKLESKLAQVSSHSEGQVGEYSQCSKTIEELTEHICHLQEENKVLQDKLSANKSCKIETTKVESETKKQRYTDNLKQSVYAC